MSAPASRGAGTELPLIGRDIADLCVLSPGVKAANSYDPTKKRYAILSVNGAGGARERNRQWHRP